jgi:Reverse transcriptase (RNA-dependent DNA polymerase)
MLTRSKTVTKHLLLKALLATNHPTPSFDLDRTSYTQASKSEHWRVTMTQELDALARNKTWSLVPVSEASNIMGCKWVFKIKHRSYDTIERFKARLVVKGYTQEEGLDYTDTFSPVIKPTIIKLILSLVVTSNLNIRQLDVNSVFLHGKLQETIYMKQPSSFQDTQFPTHVCKMHKSIYGLKQSTRA